MLTTTKRVRLTKDFSYRKQAVLLYLSFYNLTKGLVFRFKSVLVPYMPGDQGHDGIGMADELARHASMTPFVEPELLFYQKCGGIICG